MGKALLAVAGIAALTAALMGGVFYGALKAFTDEDWPEWPE